MSPTIGVVVPIYRVERYVAGCIASIAAQTHAPDRVVLVDDRGGDASMELALDAAAQAGLAVEVITQPENRGLSAARNTGLASLDTDLVWFCDSDDTVELEFLEDMRRALLECDAQLAMCRTARVDEAGRTLSVDEDSFGDQQFLAGAKLARRLLLSEARGYACNKLFRRELLGDAPFPEGHVYEDVAPLLRIALQADRVALVDAPLYRYLINATSISRRFGPHTHDLFVQDDHVQDLLTDAGAFSGADADAWRWAHLRFRYDGVVFPAANMALRASLAGDGGGDVSEVVARARTLISWPDLPGSGVEALSARPSPPPCWRSARGCTPRSCAGAELTVARCGGRCPAGGGDSEINADIDHVVRHGGVIRRHGHSPWWKQGPRRSQTVEATRAPQGGHH